MKLLFGFFVSPKTMHFAEPLPLTSGKLLRDYTLVYETYAVEGEPLARVFYEVYRDRDAHADHERQPHTAAFLTSLRSLVARTRVEYLAPT